MPRLALAMTALLVVALARPVRAAAWNGSCDIHFQGTSTLHDFAGDAPCRPFRVDVETSPEGKAIIRGAEVAVPAAGMGTGNGSRDRQMRRMFDSGRYPVIRGMFGRIDPESMRRQLLASPGGKAPLDFTLAIRNVERPVHAVAGNFRERAGEVSFDVDYDLSLSDFGLVPPTVLFGLVKVADKVAVRTTVRLETGGAH